MAIYSYENNGVYGKSINNVFSITNNTYLQDNNSSLEWWFCKYIVSFKIVGAEKSYVSCLVEKEKLGEAVINVDGILQINEGVKDAKNLATKTGLIVKGERKKREEGKEAKVIEIEAWVI
jgi:hypothetical protein